MNWLKGPNLNLAGRESTMRYFQMYKGKGRKIISDTTTIKVAQLENFLYIQLENIINHSVVFVTAEEGTDIVIIDSKTHKIKDRIFNPFISPKSILTQGKLISESDREAYASFLTEELEVEVYVESRYEELDAVEKVRYRNNAWNLSRTLVYKIAR